MWRRLGWTAAFSLLVLSGLLQAADAESFETAASPQGCMPKLEGPIPVTATSKAYSRIENAPPGYVEEEFFISCTVQSQPYKTVLHVIRPEEPTTESGITVVEPWHFGDNWTIFNSLKDYFVRRHDVSIVVVARAGISERFFKPADPARYASLSLPDSSLTSPEVLAQAGALIKSGKVPGVAVRRLFLSGHSETAARTREYILQEHGKARLDGKNIYDGYFPSQAAVGETEMHVPDIDVPVIEIQGERELIVDYTRGKGKVVYRRPDGALYRLYEVPGMAHFTTRNFPPGSVHERAPEAAHRSQIAYEDPKKWVCDSANLSTLPMDEIKAAAFDSLVAWVDRNIPAPHAPWIETRNGGRTIVRDEFGNARGGVRSVYFDVPIGTYRSVNGDYPKDPNDQRCDWVGSFAPFSHEEMKRLYPTHEDYVRRFDRRLAELVKERWYLPEDAEELRREAALAAVP